MFVWLVNVFEFRRGPEGSRSRDETLEAGQMWRLIGDFTNGLRGALETM